MSLSTSFPLSADQLPAELVKLLSPHYHVDGDEIDVYFSYMQRPQTYRYVRLFAVPVNEKASFFETNSFLFIPPYTDVRQNRQANAQHDFDKLTTTLAKFNDYLEKHKAYGVREVRFHDYLPLSPYFEELLGEAANLLIGAEEDWFRIEISRANSTHIFLKVKALVPLKNTRQYVD